MRRLRDERGVTLIELLVAMTLSTMVFGATLLVFDSVQGNHRAAMESNDAQEQARRAIDRTMRDLRNLASPSDFSTAAGTLPQSVERNAKYDLVFKAVDDGGGVSAANPTAVKRVRYCLGQSAPANATLYQQIQPATAFTTAPPTVAQCPSTDPAWKSTRAVAQNVVNTIGGADRPVFTYSADSRLLAYDNAADLPSTTRVEADLFIDTTPNRDAREVRLRSSVILRNQNRAPTAAFNASASGRTVRLNASDSEDPEAEPLTFDWYENGTKIGSGLVLQVTYAAAGSHTYTLKVRDPAGLEGVATSPSPVVVS
jgi:prepilin-type N-terminal cleavage/methylation domain-containing protein